MTEEELADLLPEGYLRDLWEIGDVALSEGSNPDKPVIRWKKGVEGETAGAMVKGSGPVASREQTATNSRRGAHKRRKGYYEAFELAIPDDADPTIQYSLGAWLEQTWRAASGGEKNVHAECPECAHEFDIPTKGKPDVAAIKLIFDRILPAIQKTEVSGEVRHLIEQLDETIDIGELTVRTRETKPMIDAAFIPQDDE